MMDYTIDTIKDSLGARQNCVIHTPAGLNFKDYTMKLIPLTQGKFAIVDNGKYEWLNQWKWCAHKNGNNYYAVRKDGNSIVKMHREILGLKKGDNKNTDHRNHNGIDNRIINLRICSRFQNQHNRSIEIGGTSKYKGVSRQKDANKWVVYITFNNRRIYLGCFDDEVDAAESYDAKAKELFGEFAYLNFKGE